VLVGAQKPEPGSRALVGLSEKVEGVSCAGDELFVWERYRRGSSAGVCLWLRAWDMDMA
jgi:hypothetical protein